MGFLEALSVFAKKIPVVAWIQFSGTIGSSFNPLEGRLCWIRVSLKYYYHFY